MRVQEYIACLDFYTSSEFESFKTVYLLKV